MLALRDSLKVGNMRNKEFEAIVFSLYGSRYSFEVDQDGYYARGITKRMYDIYCKLEGII